MGWALHWAAFSQAHLVDLILHLNLCRRRGGPFLAKQNEPAVDVIK
jgi:hypothetical protein